MIKFINTKKEEVITESVEEVLDTNNIPITMESVQDIIYNYKTSVPVDRSTRKMIYDVYKLEEDIKRAIAGGKDKSIITDMKREVVRLRKNLNNAKRGLSSEEVSEVKRIEKAAINELKKMNYKESVDELDDENVITEGVLDKELIAIISPLIATLAGITSYELFNAVRDKTALKKFLELEKDCVPFSELSSKVYDVKSFNNQPDLKKEYKNAFSKLIHQGFNAVTIYYYKDEIYFIVSVKTSRSLTASAYTTNKKVVINPVHQNAKKYSDYYMAAFCNKINMDTRGTKKWAKDVIKRYKKEKSEVKKESVIESLSSLNVNLITEKADLDAEMKPIVDKLNEKGYKVKYASPGHKNLRKKEDKEPDGVYNGKLYSDARIMFDKEYDMGEAPKGWKWRIVDGCFYLDVKDKTHNPDEDKRTPDEIFAEWKKEYMDSLRKFVDELDSKKSGETTEENIRESVNSLFSESMMDLEEVLN